MHKINDIINSVTNLLSPVFEFFKTKKSKKKPQRDYVSERKYIAGLIINVLKKKLIVREALLKFPKNLHDPSAIVAYHALIHFEADEELRAKDKLYMQEQNNYIIFIAQTFQKGEELPQNVIEEYKKFYRWAPSQFSNTKEGMFEKLKRFINI